MSGKKEFGRAAPGIATRAELEARIKSRPKPRLERHLTITGTEERIVHGQVNAANENRIRILRERFSVLKDKARGDQAQARLAGKAKGDFGRADD
jgi:hypothetical protein